MNKPNGIYPFSDVEGFAVSIGERSGLVMIIQIILDELSLYYDTFGTVPKGGEFDFTTERAVRRFQKANRIAQTGAVDRITWNRLCEEYNAVLWENQ